MPKVVLKKFLSTPHDIYLQKKITKGISLIKLRRMANLFEGPSYSSKDAPLSNVLSFASFEQLPDSLRSRLWTFVSRKITKCDFFSRKSFQNVITLIKRTVKHMGIFFL